MNNLIGVATGISFADPATQKTGTLSAPLDPMINSELKSNGDPVHLTSHALLSGSPAINNGNNKASLQYDQRGVGFIRKSGTETEWVVRGTSTAEGQCYGQ